MSPSELVSSLPSVVVLVNGQRRRRTSVLGLFSLSADVRMWSGLSHAMTPSVPSFSGMWNGPAQSGSVVHQFEPATQWAILQEVDPYPPSRGNEASSTRKQRAQQGSFRGIAPTIYLAYSYGSWENYMHVLYGRSLNPQQLNPPHVCDNGGARLTYRAYCTGKRMFRKGLQNIQHTPRFPVFSRPSSHPPSHDNKPVSGRCRRPAKNRVHVSKKRSDTSYAECFLRLREVVRRDNPHEYCGWLIPTTLSLRAEE
ncbi:hypothetical protein BXZ70DRAFT_908562 [Cristinia sonorae]|uniref:Uncharacterized protein n=1 Tax=Cristinia sonorae TaxID=1940300 RepID=A0A8K0UME1_9AGAR|nr:hypothetical protein BXZ70DRAFT_908562 [Cristinia sonorae]